MADLVTGCTGVGLHRHRHHADRNVCRSTRPRPQAPWRPRSVPRDNGPDCANDPFRHAPEVTTYNAIGMDANILFTVTFDNASADGLWYVPFEVCFQAQTPFTDYFGNAGRDDRSPTAVREPRRGPMRSVDRRVARPSGQSQRRRHCRRDDRGATDRPPQVPLGDHGQRGLTMPREGRQVPAQEAVALGPPPELLTDAPRSPADAAVRRPKGRHRPPQVQAASCVSTRSTEQGAPCATELGTLPSTRRFPGHPLVSDDDEIGLFRFGHSR